MTSKPMLSCAALVLLAGCTAAAPKPAESPLGADTRTAPGTPPLRAVRAVAPPTLPAAPGELTAAAKALDAAVHAQADKGFARADGYAYAADIAPLLLYAARRGDAELYGKLLPAAQALVLQNDNDPYTRGFVLWRTRDGAKPGRSDAASALWLARAFWAGAQKFGRPDDRALALGVLDGYVKHAYVLHGVWLARRAFDFTSRGYDDLSLSSAYQADFLADVERAGAPGEWRGFAERSYGLLERAATPSRLLLPVVQPEVGANYPGANLELYAPNGVAGLEDSCLGAEGAAAGLPRVATGVLAFAVESARANGGKLHAQYAIEDGRAIGDAGLGPDGDACLERVAAALGSSEGLALADPRITADLVAAAKSRATLPGAGRLLLAAEARGAF